MAGLFREIPGCNPLLRYIGSNDFSFWKCCCTHHYSRQTIIKAEDCEKKAIKPQKGADLSGMRVAEKHVNMLFSNP
jgi:hypothetical protein